MKNFPDLGFQIPDILLPEFAIDHTKWAVIACDQYTSQPEYWERVKQVVGNSPSTFHMILPEIYLETPEESARIKSTQQAMRDYLERGLFINQNNLILVERKTVNHTRHGIMLALDLEQYDFNKGSQTLIRATEGTIIERLPPRIRIRENAPLELSHILVLIDDPSRTVIEPLVARKSLFKKIYDFDLMLEGGHLTGYSVAGDEFENNLVSSLRKLADPEAFSFKYNLFIEKAPLLFAMGDGNHSLATAKAIWEKNKSKVGMDHPSRYALVEVENLHDEGLEFEPIHRILFNVKRSFFADLEQSFGNRISFDQVNNREQLIEGVNQVDPDEHKFGVAKTKGFTIVKVKDPLLNLPVGTLQNFLDQWLKLGGAEKVDYVHGEEVVFSTGALPGNLGIYLPPMVKDELFKTVIKDGVLPRKTFSMGMANEKRFYMECRKIS